MTRWFLRRRVALEVNRYAGRDRSIRVDYHPRPRPELGHLAALDIVIWWPIRRLVP